MFDWPIGKPTVYHPHPPAFYSIADELQTVDEQEYVELQAELIRRGEQRSKLGRACGSGLFVTPALSTSPAPVAREEIEQAIKRVMARIHPTVARHEQILRCAFIGHLPERIRERIGTLAANLHPELPTPSKEYQRKGSNKRRARIDIGFGHPTLCEAIAGVIEMKALTSYTETWFDREREKMIRTREDLMFSGLAGDFQKLLDPKLPGDAFRFSWVVTKKRSSAKPEQIAEWAQSLLRPVEERLSLGVVEQRCDDSTEWLRWGWSNGVVLNLAWYWPKEDCAEKFEPVWDAESVADKQTEG